MSTLTSVWCVTHCHVISRNCTLATNAVAVAEWFDRAWLQIFVNELAPPTLQTVLVGAYNTLKERWFLGLMHLITPPCGAIRWTMWTHRFCVTGIPLYLYHIRKKKGCFCVLTSNVGDNIFATFNAFWSLKFVYILSRIYYKELDERTWSSRSNRLKAERLWFL